MNAHRSVVVVGGAGAVGTMLVELLRGDNLPVIVIDPREKDFAAGAADITAPDEHLRSLLRNASVVILAVPEPVALAADLSAVSDEALVVETLSVKTRFAALVRSQDHRRATLGINPMFAPSLGIVGRPVAAVEHRSGAAVAEFLDRIESWGGRAVLVDADKHDRLAAAMQALTHSAILSFGIALADLEVSIDDLRSLAPPPHATALAMLARITGGEPEVYWDVQAGNPYAQNARAALNAATLRVADAVDAGSESGFAELMSDARSGLGSSSTYYSDLCALLFGIVRGDRT